MTLVSSAAAEAQGRGVRASPVLDLPTVGVLVDLASGVPEVQAVQHLPPGTEVVLGRGHLVLSSVDGCRRYTLDGGRATVGPDRVEVSGGRLRVDEQPNCQPIRPQAHGDAAFPGAVWRDRVVRGPVPVFSWAGAGASVSVTAVDVMPPQVVWQARGVAGWLAYAGPPLIRGARYLVEATTTDGRVTGALFLIDPDQDRLPVLAARLVPVTDSRLRLATVVAATQALAP